MSRLSSSVLQSMTNAFKFFICLNPPYICFGLSSFDLSRGRVPLVVGINWWKSIPPRLRTPPRSSGRHFLPLSPLDNYILSYLPSKCNRQNAQKFANILCNIYKSMIIKNKGHFCPLFNSRNAKRLYCTNDCFVLQILSELPRAEKFACSLLRFLQFFQACQSLLPHSLL